MRAITARLPAPPGAGTGRRAGCATGLPEPWSRVWRAVAFGSVVVPALALRLWALTSVGFNSDEAVYAGQAASIAGDPELLPYFPVFRAHPLLFQTMLSLFYHDGVSDLVGRLLAVGFGMANVAVAYLLGKELYGERCGYLSALLVALMPYHVVVSRQVLLDGPMVFFAGLSLYLLARYANTGRSALLYAAAGALGLAVLSKETAVVLVGSAYAFFALTRIVRLRARQVSLALLALVVTILPFPAAIMLSGRTSTGQNFLVWQLFRRPNHSSWFYAEIVPWSLGLLVVVAATAGVVVLRGRRTWREVLLLSWILVPITLFTVWPVKGYQYLLPVATPVAVLAARWLSSLPGDRRSRMAWPRGPLVAVVLVSLGAVAAGSVRNSTSGTTILAGTGGVPGGREAGEWVASNVPVGATLLAIGPSMANIIQFYGHRRTFGLSVSPNPLHRNPTYEPVSNPDAQLRRSEIQYLVWDSYSASRSEFFSSKLLRYAERYHGRVAHTEYVAVRTDDGHELRRPTIVIYEVRP